MWNWWVCRNLVCKLISSVFIPGSESRVSWLHPYFFGVDHPERPGCWDKVITSHVCTLRSEIPALSESESWCLCVSVCSGSLVIQLMSQWLTCLRSRSWSPPTLRCPSHAVSAEHSSLLSSESSSLQQVKPIWRWMCSAPDYLFSLRTLWPPTENSRGTSRNFWSTQPKQSCWCGSSVAALECKKNKSLDSDSNSVAHW